MSAADFFSADYAEARAKFLDAAAGHGLLHEALEHPSETGPQGEPLYMDVATWGDPEAENALFLLSATHGVEGFCGSGCQTGALLTRGAPPAGVRLVFIHALNPFGFAWLRRCNEDNIDLNRNFVDFDHPLPDNPAYEELKDAIAPTSLSDDALTEANERLKDYAKTHGPRALQAAISQGQYAHADGLYYGGVGPAWSNGALRGVVAKHAGKAKRIALIDFHTGLGPFGYGEPIVEFSPGTPQFDRAAAWWGDAVRSTTAGDSVSVKLTGTVDVAFTRMAAHAEATVMALEFGTYSTTEVFAATRADNWLHRHADPQGPEAQAIKQEIRRVFYPDTDEWKGQVWACAEERIEQGVEGLLRSVEAAR